MSWTENNYSNPQGDWGQAAENNDIGFGQAAMNNAISWGVAHVLSWGHAITNLYGNLAPSVSYALSFDGVNDYTQLNTIINLVDDFEVSFIKDSSGLSYPLSGSISTYFVAESSTNIYYRCGGDLITFNEVVTLGTKVTLKRNQALTRVEMYLDDVFIDSKIINGSNLTSPFAALYMMKAGVSYGEGKLSYLEFNDATQNSTFNFPEGSGSTTKCDEFAINGVYATIYGATWVEL